MWGRRNKGFLHLILTGFIFAFCVAIVGSIVASAWPFDTLSAALLLGSLITMALLLFWRGIANLRAYRDLYLLDVIRKTGGRITANQLAERACSNLTRVNRFLESKVQRGQAVVSRDDDEPTYIFDGFLDQTGKDLAFKL